MLGDAASTRILSARSVTSASGESRPSALCSGDDRLFGEAGKEKLKGGSGKDKLSGGSGKDTCVGGSGTDKAPNCEKEKSIP